MRVIAGKLRGRRLRTVASNAVRPTADRVKEAVFSMIGSRLDYDGGAVLDLYAGSGALGIEALSRGAQSCVFVERDRRAGAVLRTNLDACGLRGAARVVARGVAASLESLAQDGAEFDLIVADPPYATDPMRVVDQVAAAAVLGEGGLLVVEHDRSRSMEGRGDLRLTLTRPYGKTSVTMFVRETGEENSTQ